MRNMTCPKWLKLQAVRAICREWAGCLSASLPTRSPVARWCRATWRSRSMSLRDGHRAEPPLICSRIISNRSPRLRSSPDVRWSLRMASRSTMPLDSRPPGPENSTSCQFVRLFVRETSHFVMVVAHLAVCAALWVGFVMNCPATAQPTL